MAESTTKSGLTAGQDQGSTNIKGGKPARRKPKWLFVAAALVVILAGLKAAAPLIVPFLLAVFLSLLGAPVVLWLQKRKVPLALAVILVVLVMLGFVLGVVLLVGSSVTQLTAMIPKYQARFNELVVAGTSWLEAHGVEVSEKKLMGALDPGAVMGLVGGTLKSLAATLSNAVLVILTVTFILLEVSGFPAKMRAAMGDSNADLSRFARVTADVKTYLIYKTAVSLVTGVIAAGWTAILGVDFPILWGLLAFLMNYIPNLGSVLAAVPPTLLALLMQGPMTGILVAGGYVAINMVLGNVVEPMLMGRRLGLSTLVVFLSLIFWGWLWGPVGMLLSVPLTMVVKILLDNSENYHWVAVLLDSKVPSGKRGKKGLGRRPGRFAKRVPGSDPVAETVQRSVEKESVLPDERRREVAQKDVEAETEDAVETEAEVEAGGKEEGKGEGEGEGREK